MKKAFFWVVVLVFISVLISGSFGVPLNFIPVPPDSSMGTIDTFFVAKYEMKILGNDNGDVAYDSSFKAECRPSGTPWKNLNQNQACTECEELGDGFSLISTAEWMTIARNIESVGRNWSDNQSHPLGETSAKLNVGHTCRKGFLGVDCRTDGTAYSLEALAASENDSLGCFGYEKGAYEEAAPALNSNGWNLYRRTHFLSNGEVIWDFSGNVWDWTDLWVINAVDRPFVGETPSEEWFEINEANPTSTMPAFMFQSANPLVPKTINANGFGRIHPGAADSVSGSAMRGGNYMHGAYNNGIYAIGMGYGPDADKIICQVGFRCVWHKPEEANLRSKIIDRQIDYISHTVHNQSVTFSSPVNQKYSIDIFSLQGVLIRHVDSDGARTQITGMARGAYSYRVYLRKTVQQGTFCIF